MATSSLWCLPPKGEGPLRTRFSSRGRQDGVIAGGLDPGADSSRARAGSLLRGGSWGQQSRWARWMSPGATCLLGAPRTGQNRRGNSRWRRRRTLSSASLVKTPKTQASAEQLSIKKTGRTGQGCVCRQSPLLLPLSGFPLPTLSYTRVAASQPPLPALLFQPELPGQLPLTFFLGSGLPCASPSSETFSLSLLATRCSLCGSPDLSVMTYLWRCP